MSIAKFHAEWLSLLEISGPFLSLPVLKKVFPQGLDAHDSDHFRMLRQVHEEWDDNQQGLKPDPAIHTQWIKWVLRNTLELEEVLVEGQDIPQTLKAEIEEPQHRETLRPDMVVMGPDKKARLLIQWYPLSQKLGRTVEGKPWKVSPDTRMTQLLRDSGVPLGLITNGDQWMLVYAPQGETSGYASWYSTLWLEEQKTLAAFRTLLSLHRFFGVPDDETLVPMLAESASTQQEVTDQLGSQVRSAVEILIQSLDRADQDYGRELLADVPEEVLYEAALTVMMRLVFLFCAEERELLLLGDQLFDQHYAVSTLVAQLQNTADQHGEEILERRLDAWCRLLSTFRAVYGGVNHDRMHLPAYSGNLFDPDRFPFLEGRKSDTSWKDTEANPLPINNRTVLHLLRSLQYLEMHGEAQRLSFRALDIEQIGHVYEGLLDHTAKRSTAPVLGLVGKHEPETPLAQLEEQRAKGNDDFFDYLKKETGSGRKWDNYLDQDLDSESSNRLRSACGNDEDLFERVLPYAKLIRNDTFGRPVVIGKNSFFVTAGTDRRSSGTHYTPRSLTEPIVKHTLEPLAYEGPAEGKSREEWKLKSPKELLELKVCDMACGSGAFLVQAARYMAERLLEAWEAVERESPDGTNITPFGESSTGEPDEQLIPDDTHERVIYARRIVAQRCLYGVDVNPLAADMAKLSLWLLTLAKDKPFTFLDHSIRCGDSLVGIHSVEQLLNFSLSRNVTTGPLLEQQRQQIENRINATILLRKQIETLPSHTVSNVERKAEMLKRADEQAVKLEYAADLLLCASWGEVSKNASEAALNASLIEASENIRSQDYDSDWYCEASTKSLRASRIAGRFHWPLEYPEVFAQNGFDAIVGNPPFVGGQRISGSLGAEYRDYLVNQLAHGMRGSADLCAYFFLRAASLLRSNAHLGFLATNTIAQGETREVGIDQLCNNGCVIPRAVRSRKWPGLATVEVAHVWVRRGAWNGPYVLDDKTTEGITSFLSSPSKVVGKPKKLKANAGLGFQGNIVLGKGFVLPREEAAALIKNDPKNAEVLFPYLNGQDVNLTPNQSARRWVIQFDERTEEEAKRFPDVWAIAEQRVKPERMKKDVDKYPRMVHEWWKHWNNRRELRQTISSMDRVIVRARVSDTHAFAIVPSEQVFSDQIVVIAKSDFSCFAVLQSELHNWWYRPLTSSMRTDVRYSPTDVVETFPWPAMLGNLDDIGERYFTHRKALMLEYSEGLTKAYNRFHDKSDESQQIRQWRDLQVELDQAVATEYDFQDLPLDHDFHTTDRGVRFTISAEAQAEVLNRLLALNLKQFQLQKTTKRNAKRKPGSAPEAMSKSLDDDNTSKQNLLF
ncbi:Eco57I restriction-modification methylase domain-containing protein [Roseiconus lacunae]|uniref:Eco57I restriction-modification methylase domain-containing protein n=1 Tax=Roseiconus lacunae TaxID=2605694 RepID=UPI001E5307C6|nr:DNA methyltransferase [Roseiconus lacunae]MCD0459556.1 N-6 DNA methylase [Roseiconus lacunae]